jgi:hypothetical protein
MSKGGTDDQTTCAYRTLSQLPGGVKTPIDRFSHAPILRVGSIPTVLRSMQLLMNCSRFSRCLLSAAAGVYLLLAGCASDGEFGGRTAVVIYNEKAEDILDATARVFAKSGFSTASRTKNSAMFERTGSAMQNAAYRTWMGGKMWEQAEVTVEPYAKGAHLVWVDAKLVQNKDEEFFKHEHKMSRRARKPYQEMLNQVASDLSGVPMVSDDS